MQVGSYVGIRSVKREKGMVGLGSGILWMNTVIRTVLVNDEVLYIPIHIAFYRGNQLKNNTTRCVVTIR